MRVLKRARPDPAAIEANIREAIVVARSLLHVSNARLELVSFELESGIATVRFEGECPDCELSASTLAQGIEQHLRTRVQAIRAVRLVPASDATLDG